MKFLFDENLSPRLAQALEVLGEEVVHITELCPKGTQDTKWLELAGAEDMIAVSRDQAILRRPNELSALRQNKVGLFLVFGKKRGAWDQVVQIITHWEQMKDLASKARRPFAYRVPQRGGIKSKNLL